MPLSRPQLGTWPTTQTIALTRTRTGDLSIRRPGTQSTEPHEPGPDLHVKDHNGGEWLEEVKTGYRGPLGDVIQPRVYGGMLTDPNEFINGERLLKKD